MRWRVAGALVVLAVGVDRLVLGVHHVSDLIGGALVALCAMALSVELSGARRAATSPSPPRRVAVVVNPLRVSRDGVLRRIIAAELAARGWPEADWLPTTADDPGRGMARQAISRGADLILTLGGDGTVRAVCADLLGNATPVGLIPTGTGNLLALNLGVPLDAREALRVALDGSPSPIDLIRVELPGRAAEHAAVLVGAGADAAVLADSDERVKRRAGAAAYLLAGLRHVKARPVNSKVVVDGEAPLVRAASLVEVGNVGELRPGVALLPGADAADGVLDVLVASPRRTLEVTRLMAGVLAGGGPAPVLDRVQGRHIEVSFAEPVPCQADGDVLGETTRLVCEVVPAAVQVMMPRGR